MLADKTIEEVEALVEALIGIEASTGLVVEVVLTPKIMEDLQTLIGLSTMEVVEVLVFLNFCTSLLKQLPI